MLGVAGVTAMDFSVFCAAVTVKVADPVIPVRVAVMVLVPAATPVATPEALMVAAAGLEDVHATEEVMTAVEPSL
jgi:hypothetical protein